VIIPDLKDKEMDLEEANELDEEITVINPDNKVEEVDAPRTRISGLNCMLNNLNTLF
jgi:hypothetical protein